MLSLFRGTPLPGNVNVGKMHRPISTQTAPEITSHCLFDQHARKLLPMNPHPEKPTSGRRQIEFKPSEPTQPSLDRSWGWPRIKEFLDLHCFSTTKRTTSSSKVETAKRLYGVLPTAKGKLEALIDEAKRLWRMSWRGPAKDELLPYGASCRSSRARRSRTRRASR